MRDETSAPTVLRRMGLVARTARLAAALVAAALLVAPFAALSAQETPYLVRDIETTGQPWYHNGCPILCPPDFGSVPRWLTPFGARVVFTA